jgi:ATP-binding cassette subfamily E protein 1
MARLIHRVSQESIVVVIEHDLAILDFLADTVHLMYGEPGAYGVFAHPRAVRAAINTYLSGYLREENVRFREKPIRFVARPPRVEWVGGMLQVFPRLEKDLGGFRLETGAGVIHEGESVGVVGPNATGKTTFVNMLAGVLQPDKGSLEGLAEVSYKPQYISPEFEGTVKEYLYTELGEEAESAFFSSEIERPLTLKDLYLKDMGKLSGGELQRVAIGTCLARKVDLYLLDEPSAYLDSNQRMEAARTIRRVMEKGGTSALIVDHDVYFLDLVSDTLMVFSGEPSVRGEARGPLDLREGMNLFLSQVGITFRRDTESLRPRINKDGSRLDREQKDSGEYYFCSS